MSAVPSRIGWIISRHERRVVLVVGVDHDHHVGAAAQRLEVARLLVAAVAAVLDVHDDFQAQPLGDIDRVVVADVVDQDDFVDHVHGQAAIGLLERARRVVRGHDHHDPGAVLHGRRHGAMIVGRRRPASACSPALESHAPIVSDGQKPAARLGRADHTVAAERRQIGRRPETRPSSAAAPRPPSRRASPAPRRDTARAAAAAIRRRTRARAARAPRRRTSPRWP